MSHVAHPEDHIALSWRTPSGSSGHRRISPYSRAALTAASGTRKPGDDGIQAWPGVGADPPLVVVADELTVRFVSVGGAAEEGKGETATPGGAWGFRLTAKGRKVRFEQEKERSLVSAFRLPSSPSAAWEGGLSLLAHLVRWRGRLTISAQSVTRVTGT